MKDNDRFSSALLSAFIGAFVASMVLVLMDKDKRTYTAKKFDHLKSKAQDLLAKNEQIVYDKDDKKIAKSS